MVIVASSFFWFRNKTKQKNKNSKTNKKSKGKNPKPKAKLFFQLSDNEAENTSVLLVAEISHLLILPFLWEYRCTEVASCDQDSEAVMVEKETFFLTMLSTQFINYH